MSPMVVSSVRMGSSQLGPSRTIHASKQSWAPRPRARGYLGFCSLRTRRAKKSYYNLLHLSGAPAARLGEGCPARSGGLSPRGSPCPQAAFAPGPSSAPDPRLPRPDGHRLTLPAQRGSVSLLGGKSTFLVDGDMLARSIALSSPCVCSSSAFGVFCPVPPRAHFLLSPGQSYPQGLAQKYSSTHEGTRSSCSTPSATQSPLSSFVPLTLSPRC